MSERDGTLRLILEDVHGKPLNEAVDVIVQHLQLHERKVFKNVKPGGATLSELRRQPEGLHLVEVDPPSYLQVRRIVTIAASGETVERFRFPIDPKKVVGIKFPAFSALTAERQRVLTSSNIVLRGHTLTGEALYDALDELPRAGFLNITAKAGQCILTSGRSVLGYVHRLTEIMGDRFFAIVDPSLSSDLQSTALTGALNEAGSALHRPDPGFEHAGSFKTLDPFANLQVTLFTNGTDWKADLDIDDANGFEHIFQVVHNGLTQQPTHPFNIHELLLGSQDLDPGYELQV
jgi:hypothetical protein